MTNAQPGPSAERTRLNGEHTEAWKRWGPYVAERAWGTVREDYSADGEAWDSFPFDHAVSRTYRWNEDGLCAWSDRRQFLCLGLSLWNGHDQVLKERAFGLNGAEGNHGEDAKDYWWYVDNTPTHSWMRTRYAYPLGAFPYDELRAASAGWGRSESEFELLDTGIFDVGHVMVTSDWAKAGPDDLCLRISVENRGAETATVHVLPTAWFRNTWSWGDAGLDRPSLRADGGVLRGSHQELGEFTVTSSSTSGAEPRLLFCENETNVGKLFGADTFAGAPATPYPKDGINDHLLHGADSVNPEQRGTKASFHHELEIGPGETAEVRVRLRFAAPADDSDTAVADLGSAGDLAAGFDEVLTTREREADEFWAERLGGLDDQRRHVCRQALAGVLASKQFYAYDVRRWLSGDPGHPPPPEARRGGRNADWQHLIINDVLLMPDPWEYPWFAAWDSAFQCVAAAVVDPALAKQQLLLLLDEWFQHPSGQVPAYEWDFSDVNPPVQAWAAYQVFLIDGGTDHAFLKRALHKLLLDFTWWVNRKDPEGNNLFEGGFLGLDNVGPFDRSAPLPNGGRLEQSDGTSWMAMYCLDLLQISLAVAAQDDAYDELAVKFLQHFCAIASAANELGLWNEQDGFYYDLLRPEGGTPEQVPVRSVVGLLPLVAVVHLDSDLLQEHPHIAERLAWLQDNRPEYDDAIHFDEVNNRDLLAVVQAQRLVRVLERMLDDNEFLSPFGLRSLSAAHRNAPVTIDIGGARFGVGYEPAEGETAMFGGNSNWRGPIWFPVNALLVGTLRRYGTHLGDQLTVEFPTGSGNRLTLDAVADALTDRLMALFLPDADGQRPCQPGLPWQDDVLFNEYFHGDTGRGLGATHQTGWTALVAALALGWPR